MKVMMKRILTILSAVSILAATPAFAYAAEMEATTMSSETEYTEIVTVVPGSFPMPHIVSDTGRVSLRPGESFYKSFKMNNGSNPAHTRFRVTLADVSGSWYVTVTGSNGYSYTSSTYSTDGYVEISNAQKDVTYRVTFYNGSSTYGLTADYSVVSSL